MKKVAFIFFITLFLTGCWDKTEVDEMAMVMAIGIDLTEKGLYDVTLQIAKPRAFGKETPGKPGEKAFLTVTTQGKTVSEAMVKFYDTSPRRVYLGHNKIVVFGKKISEKGIKEVLDWVERVQFLRFSTYIFTTPKTAKEILNGTYELEKIPSLAIQSTIQLRYKYLVEFTPTINRFIERMLSHNKVTFATNLAMVNNDLEFQGIGIFKDGRLIHHLDNKQTQDFMRLFNRVKGGVVLIPCKNNPKNYTSFEIIKEKTTVTPEIKGKKVTMHIATQVDGRVDSSQCGEKILTKRQVKLLEKEINQIIKKRLHSIITLAQKDLKTDILYFDELIKEKKNSQWPKLEKNWEKIFPNVKTEIVVNSHIQHFSWVKDPIPKKQKNK